MSNGSSVGTHPCWFLMLTGILLICNHLSFFILGVNVPYLFFLVCICRYFIYLISIFSVVDFGFTGQDDWFVFFFPDSLFSTSLISAVIFINALFQFIQVLFLLFLLKQKAVFFIFNFSFIVQICSVL